MTLDPETIRVYATQAQTYADLVSTDKPDATLAAFLDALPANSHLLDLGCGPGQAAAQMAQCGHTVLAMDATPEMVAMAAAHPGVTAHQATFDDITGTDLYDGIWANFSLLHAPRAALPDYLSAVAHALKPGGVFHIGMKTGEGEERDDIGRLYTYVTETELSELLTQAGLTPFARQSGREAGLSGVVAPWIAMLARRA